MTKIPPTWISEVQPLGFMKHKDILERHVNGIEQTIFAKKNLHENTFQVWATVGIPDPYLNGRHNYVFWSYVCPAGLRFFSNDSWWPAEDLANAASSIVRFAIPWLENHSTIHALLLEVEECLLKGRSWHYNLAKSDQPSRPENSLYYHASLLHMVRGDKESSCWRAAEWLTFVQGSIGSDEPDRTLRQMRDLGCKLP